MTDSHRYCFTVPLWEHPGDGGWQFVTLPEASADEIKAITDGVPRRGFGSVRVEASVGPSTWRTSIFPSAQAASYVLPMKREVRARAGIEPGDDVDVTLDLLLEE